MVMVVRPLKSLKKCYSLSSFQYIAPIALGFLFVFSTVQVEKVYNLKFIVLIIIVMYIKIHSINYCYVYSVANNG